MHGAFVIHGDPRYYCYHITVYSLVEAIDGVVACDVLRECLITVGVHIAIQTDANFHRHDQKGAAYQITQRIALMSLQKTLRYAQSATTEIRRNPNSACDNCRSTIALSDALIIAADAARQQIQPAPSVVPSDVSPPPPAARPVSSSELIPAVVVSTVISNREKVAFALLDGLTYHQYKERELFTGGCMAKPTWYFHQQEILKVIKIVENKAEDTVVDIIKSRDQWIAAADGGWSQRRNASHHAFIMMDSESKKIVHSEILDKQLKKTIKNRNYIPNSNEEEYRTIIVQQGNCTTTSHGMEGEAIKRTLDWLENKGILCMMTDFVIRSVYISRIHTQE